ncbi:cytochrome P450, putative [Ricinus communis]|uniref:Cytochrome P450, putative n=1 Tax=Ricinus communis TaxID=3988 RepID=B9RBR0_RICCO|nr:cytochrome P450, putative [Ricinus communis]
MSGAVMTMLVSVILSFLFLWNVIKRSKKGISPLPPGPRGFPVLGYLPFLGTELHKKFTELAGVYGPIYKLWLGNKLCVVISSPSVAKEVVRDQDATCADRDASIVAKIATYGGNDIGWCPYGPLWKKLRKLFVGKLLSNASLEVLSALRKQEIKNSTRNAYNKIGKPIDIGELAFLTSINTIMNMLWGGTLEEEASNKARKEFRNLLAEMMEITGKPNISDFFPMLAMFDLQGLKKQAEKIVQGYESFFYNLIES